MVVTHFSGYSDGQVSKVRTDTFSAAAQTVIIIADTKEGKTHPHVEFEKKGDVLVSRTRLPAGDGYNLVLQFKQSADTKPQNFRFKLETHTCSGCKRAEYACICDE